MMEVTLQLPDRVYRQAERWASITNQQLDAALTEAIEVALTSVHAELEEEITVASLSDSEVIALSRVQLPAESGRRLSQLSAGHAEGTLQPDEQQELLSLSGLYQRLWLRQSEALAEAVRRGLQSEMHS
jgi:hypothetical protein